MDNNKIRADFPILKRKMSDQPMIYFDNGATTLKPQPVIDAVVNYYTYLGANAHRGDYEMSAQVDAAYEGAREKVQQFIHAKKKEEIIFTSGTTDGLNRVAQMVSEQWCREGQVILTTESEHASSSLPWMTAAKRNNLEIRFIPLVDGRVTMEKVKEVWDDKVRVVCLAHVSNVLGYQAPIAEICAYAHERHAYVVVDGAQSVPHLPIDVQALDVDFYAFSAHKMLGPTGIGVLYGKYEWLDALQPTIYGGESNARYDKRGHITLKRPPFKYESGTQPIEGAIGLAAAVDYLQSVPLADIHDYEVELKQYFLDQVASNPNVQIINPVADSGIVTFNVFDKGKCIPAQDVASFLNTKGIAVRSGQHCAKLLPDVIESFGTVRASFYIYNNKSEIDVFIQALKEVTLANCVGIFF